MVVLLTMAAAQASDPLEITATAFSREDRLEVKLELEWATARLLTGAERVAPRETDLNAVFNAAQPALKMAAEDFLRVYADGSLLPTLRSEVILTNENRVHFAVAHPPAAGRTLRFEAAGLARLSSVERHGVSLTALDMVNKRMLGQSVLYADANEVQFAPLVAVFNPATNAATALDPLPTAAMVTQDRQTGTPETHPSSRKVRWWPLPVAMACVAGFVWWRNRRSSVCENR
ncbi:MAG TPA: hypothetical protein PKA41_07910 [Verrucomicrobiota bacterium]|nr:hypothetical protein [Verrucomicrobiota bacterium]